MSHRVRRKLVNQARLEPRSHQADLAKRYRQLTAAERARHLATLATHNPLLYELALSWVNGSGVFSQFLRTQGL